MRWLALALALAGAAAFGVRTAALDADARLQAATALSARAKLDSLALQWQKLNIPPQDRRAVLLVTDDSDEAPLRVDEGPAAGFRGWWRRTMTLDRGDPQAFSLPEALPVRSFGLVREQDARAQVQALADLMRAAKAYQARLELVTRGAAGLSRAAQAAALAAAEGAAPARVVALGVTPDLMPSPLPAAPEGFVAAHRPRVGEPIVVLRDASGAWQAAPPTTFAGDDPLAAAVALAAQREPIKLYAEPAVAEAASPAPASPKPDGPTAADLKPRARSLKGKWSGWLDWSGHKGQFDVDLPTEDRGEASGTLVLAGPGGTQRAPIALDADVTGNVVSETLAVSPRMKCQGQLRDSDTWMSGACWSPDGSSRAFRLDRK